MPETSGQSVIRGWHKAPPRHGKKMKHLEELLPPPPPPQNRDVMSPPASGSQSGSSKGFMQQRPSVLCQVSQTASRQQHGMHLSVLSSTSSQQSTPLSFAVSICKEESDPGGLLECSIPNTGSSPGQSHHYILPLRTDAPKLISGGTRLYEGSPEGSSALFVSGLCRWPGCDAESEDFPTFLKHLHSEHSHGDKSIAQWKVQQELVQGMESQLMLEKQKLLAMQLHLHLSEHIYTDVRAASEWPRSLPLFLPQAVGAHGDAVQQWSITNVESQHGYRAHLLPDLVSGIECYKYNNIRPPYTYACLIRLSILASPDKQRTLNEIYNWFTTMFFFFRHNTATWKNAVRHNLSLHKCFVRVEGGKGAVWTVDETEYQRRKGQKYHRDCPVKWL